MVAKYLNKISGPLLDRIDLHVEVTPVPIKELSTMERSEKSDDIRARVIKAREHQTERFKDFEGIYANAQLPPRLIRKYCAIDKSGETLLSRAMEKLGLSARAYDRILKVARTIADLGGSEQIQPEHLAEAIQYRSLDRDSWAA